MTWRMIRAILILPGTALFLVPMALLWTTGIPDPASVRGWQLWLALILLAPGLILAVWTSRLFLTLGEGTPAPWDPPRKLVVRGPYRHVRNPMISAVLVLLLAEALFFRSWPIAGWLAVFFAANAVYFPFSEEPGLEKRFGEAYRQYKKQVPRWIPRLRPWNPP
jgi:protein-S-isoprenylcysteine O-methyltransferase Ste14